MDMLVIKLSAKQRRLSQRRLKKKIALGQCASTLYKNVYPKATGDAIYEDGAMDADSPMTISLTFSYGGVCDGSTDR